MDITRAIASAVPGVRCSTQAADRVAYARDLWPRKLIDIRAGEVAEHRPQAIAWPETPAQVAALVRLAREEGIPLTPFGAGSGVCGGVLPTSTGLVLDLKRLRRWHVEKDAPLIDVEAGAMGITLEEDLQRAGFTIGHFPSSILCSTVGGWIAARGAGQCSGKYGKIEDMVVSLDVVTGTGQQLTLKRRQLGPNLIPLVVGSEGTLGVVTSAKLRLHPVPTARAFVSFEFPSTEAGWEALRQLFQAGLRPAVSRLYDPVDTFFLKQGAVKSPASKSGPKSQGALRPKLLRSLLRAPRALNQLIEATEGNLLGGARLILVFEGTAEETTDDAARAEATCERLGGLALGEGPARHWLEHRYSVSYRQAPVFRLGAFSDTMEVAAPWSKLKPLYDAVRAALGRHVLVMAHLSHAYPDGCSIYFTFSGSAEDDQRAKEKYDRAWRAALDAAIGAGGTLSHHHGVGRSKAPRLGAELGYGVALVRRVQRAFDPDGVMNPGNLAPREDSETYGAALPRGVASEGAPSGGAAVPRGNGAPAPRGDPQRDEAALAAARVALGVSQEDCLITARGEARLAEVEAEVARRGLTLGLAPDTDLSISVADWLARGAPGARDAYSDPVEQRLAGFVARLPSGEQLGVRPTPRRAVGPDLSALLLGMDGQCLELEQATLTAHPRGQRSRDLPFAGPRDPAVSTEERALVEHVARTVRG
ncbi:MAG: FAD-binding oxidoreductase [Polyangiaceae bacterium]|nr:FAD-binding oxidoreductase [Polyangiaceae bacterium]MCW5789567.1 FAD-binding oxidoreductase [Polyangiaceae bacterium]